MLNSNRRVLLTGDFRRSTGLEGNRVSSFLSVILSIPVDANEFLPINPYCYLPYVYQHRHNIGLSTYLL